MIENNAQIIQVAVLAPLRSYFDYLLPLSEDHTILQPGMRVKISFRNRELIGIFIQYQTKTDCPVTRLKNIIEIVDKNSLLPADLFALCHWAIDYYHEAPGAVFMNALPALLRQGKPCVLSKNAKKGFENKNNTIENIITLNDAQHRVVHAITEKLTEFNPILLQGVTGSGKTEVYLQVIQQVLLKQKQILVLVPEISLTPQTIQHFRERFNTPIMALHSGLSERKRLDAWILAAAGDIRIVIGTRSALFTPLPELGLIIVDEEHDLSFKQQEGFRYHARDLAIKRAQLTHIPIILGSATPALETLFKAEQGKFTHLKLERRVGSAELPQFEIIDIRKQILEQGLSSALLQEMRTHLSKGNQVMLFLNRRGYAPVLMCHACGWLVNCKRCDMRMTYHNEKNRLLCHHCESQKHKVKQCEICQGPLELVGIGTERLEQTLTKNFPSYSVVRIDRDSTRRKGMLEQRLSEIKIGMHPILIGTQMLAKGHHFPNVTLVGIVDADSGLFSSDFRGIERMGQLLIQVAGRAGRAEKAGKVLLQTHHPDHPLLHQLFHDTYQGFATSLLKEREQAMLPPYAYFALFRAEAFDEEDSMAFLQQVKAVMQPLKNVHILGPIPAPMPRRAGKYRVQLLIQSIHRPLLHRFLTQSLVDIEKIRLKNRVRWSLDIDHLEMF